MKKKYHTLSPFLKGSTCNVVKGEGLKGFTLIELMIVISIMAMILLASYAPFAHYKSKQLVRNSAKIISQVLNDSRNSAIYGIASSTGNLDIGVLIKNGEEKIGIYGFPIDDNIGNYISPDNKYHLEDIPLERGVEITSSGGLFLYKAITGSGIYKGNFNIIDKKIILSVGLKGAQSGIMTRKIEYYTKTYISNITK
ncbi:MAG: prepilin-type N-terminal cleavage/methylation domain-containing protein [Candidatus Gracilibacteria bacterium]|nr:prepilin-type N-terminal cleavage/methylation domain-containing protein [Candidatus Gracilibacteria bacterium]